MNKRDLVDAVAAQVGRPKAEVASTVDAVFALISSALQRGEKVAVSGFGNFDARQVAERVARNPRTGESVVGTGPHRCPVQGQPQPEVGARRLIAPRQTC